MHGSIWKNKMNINEITRKLKGQYKLNWQVVWRTKEIQLSRYHSRL